jgi:hypothetical protein
MVSTLNVNNSRYPEFPEESVPNINLLRRQGKISDPEQAFVDYLSKKLDVEVIQQFSVPAFDRKTLNKYYWHLDIFLPAYNLAIEVNGQQHYTDPRQFVSDYWKQQDCSRLGIVLVSFPCFPPSTPKAYQSWCYKMFKYWGKDIEKLIEAFEFEISRPEDFGYGV